VTEEEINTRVPVWVALSDLYLDAPIDDASLKRIASTLHASAYSIGELEQILFHEVHPVCADNLKSVAGNWSGFDESQLVQAIVTRLERRLSFPWPDSPQKELRTLWKQMEVLLRALL